jgi:hypothetical protein
MSFKDHAPIETSIWILENMIELNVTFGDYRADVDYNICKHTPTWPLYFCLDKGILFWY